MVGERIRKAVLGFLAGLTAIFAVAKNGQRVKPGPREARAEEPTEPVGRKGGAIVKASWDLPVEKNERVDFWIDFLQTKRHDDTREWVERLGYYGPMIQEKLRERGMPEDLVFLAMAESGLDPTAYSRADASGMWQFIAETGRRYGLEVSRYVDERNDPVKSTDAALDYLQELYDHFGSWYLAAAAYNTGENRVDRILRQRAGGRTGDESLYWQIGRFLPRETRDYVPIMLAVGHIGKDPERYGFEDIRYQEPMRFERARVAPGTRLAAVARAAGVDTEEIQRLNPHLVRGQTPPDRAWDVRVPPGTADAVERALA